MSKDHREHMGLFTVIPGGAKKRSVMNVIVQLLVLNGATMRKCTTNSFFAVPGCTRSSVSINPCHKIPPTT
jgi:hypothetical protein